MYTTIQPLPTYDEITEIISYFRDMIKMEWRFINVTYKVKDG